MGATGATTPGGSRREGADEGAVMEALRERANEVIDAWVELCKETGGGCGSLRLDEAIVRLTPEPEARHQEAARPPEPGEAPSGAPTGGELREAIQVACEHCGLPLTCNASLHEELEGVKAMIDENITERDNANAALRELLDLVHQPNPTDPSRWDVAPGKHRAFCALIERLRSATPERSEATE